MSGIESDPVLPAIERYQAAHEAYLAAEKDAGARECDLWLEALEAVYRTVPTTLRGLRAYAAVFEAEEAAALDDLGLPSLALESLLRGIRQLAVPAAESREVAAKPR